MNTTTATAAASLASITHVSIVHTSQRIAAIDQLRGFVMILMALDHVRDYFSAAHFDLLDPNQTTVGLYLTRWITHLCAPTFMVLAGVSAYLMSKRSTRAQLSRFLLTRGLWLVLLEVTMVWFGWSFNFEFEFGVGLQVIWALGVSMIVLAGLVHLPRVAIAALAFGMILGHNLLDGIQPAAFGSWAPLWHLLHVQGPIGIGFVVYPVIPWIGVMAAGFLLGAVYDWSPTRRQSMLLRTGLGMLAAFFVLRVTNFYGDPTPWASASSLTQTLMLFFDVEKYPPSLSYLLVTVGIAFVLLSLFERRPPPAANFLLTFGRVPMFFYILHIYLAHLIAGLLALSMGFGTAVLTEPFLFLPDAWGFSLPIVYLAWAAVVGMLYPLCLWYADLKRTRDNWWLSYV